ncbi:MAG: LysM peptidoglycan-binding domain-containing protein [Dehalococcoidia bacterium]|nr:LysM peptidoglycan-binding domain-containing protein [Dehalococcoidia bacterium]
MLALVVSGCLFGGDGDDDDDQDNGLIDAIGDDDQDEDEATPRPTASVTATAGAGAGQRPDEYVVQEGDTLSGIATQFDLTVDALAAANGIDNPELIQIGQTLTIPPAGASTPAVTATPAATATPVATTTP